MLTLLLALSIGALLGVLTANVWPNHPVWATVFGLLGFMVTTILANLWLKKRLEAVFNDVQKHVEGVQEQLRRRINVMQNKMMSGGKGLQKQLEDEQADGIRAALKIVDRVQPLQRWNLLALRQANTLRAQLYFQIQEFEKADKCFEKCLVMDPLTLAMKITRLYRRDEKKELKEVQKAFRKGVKRFKDEKATLLYALYSWILVKENRIDDAVAVLAEAKEKTEDETLKKNWEHLANGRVRHFSNAGLGDQWYALHLEQPKAAKARPRFAGGRFR